jgi:hypothetical protein
MLKLSFHILILLTLIGCSNKTPECSDSRVVATFSNAIKERYEEGIRPSLVVDPGVVETIKDEKNPDHGSCIATSKVSLNSDVLTKHDSLVKILREKYQVKMNGSFTSVETVESKFKIKINELTKDFFITGTYKAPYGLKSFIIEQVNDYDKIIEIGSQYSKLNKFYDLIKDSAHSGSELKQFAMENSMLVEICTFNIKSGVGTLMCRFSNDAGWIDLVHNTQNSIINFSVLPGSSQFEEMKEKDSAKIAELLNDKLYFKYSKYNNDGVCKVVPSWCSE